MDIFYCKEQSHSLEYLAKLVLFVQRSQKELTVLALYQVAVELHQRRRQDSHGGFGDASRIKEQRQEAHEESFGR